MESTVVVYTDNENLTWAVVVPVGTPEEDYQTGIVLGPPDLSSLDLQQSQRERLQKALVEAGFYNAPQLMGKRQEFNKLLKSLGLPDTYYRNVLHLYQVAYYGDSYG